LRGILSGVLALVVGVLTAADFVNAHYGYLPMVSDVASVFTGDRQWIASDQLGHLTPAQQARAERNGVVVRNGLAENPANGLGRTGMVIYLPPQYFSQPDARFPVVYLLHGSPGRPADWFHAAHGQSYGQQLARGGHPSILVAAQVSRSWTDDSECVDGVHEKVESHMFGDVIPAVDRTYRTLARRDDRVFAGMSAGGYCALNLGLRHRDVVSTVVDLSGYSVPTHSGGARALFGRDQTVAAALVRSNSPAEYAAALPRSPSTRVWLDTGSEDGTVLRQMRALVPVLRERGIDVSLHVRPGGHTYHVWTAALAQALPWAVSDSSA
jgi:enterochelin esterase-like enzyme